jgi:hypothetical protein
MSGSSCEDDASTVVDVLLFVVVVVVVVVVVFSLKSCRRFDETHRNECAVVVVVYEVLNPIIIADFILRAYQNQKGFTQNVTRVNILLLFLRARAEANEGKERERERVLTFLDKNIELKRI